MIASRLRSAAADPQAAAYRLRSRLRPEGLFARQGRLARQAGLDRVWLILSFDCDTPQDAEVAGEVHDRLLRMGACPVYAVPGELLQAHADAYRRIADTGAEFINHGGRMHTYFDERAGQWLSNFFYDQQPREVLRDDIRRGHETVAEIAGEPPTGFRTPHFGTFQEVEQLRWLHSTIGELGYRFSTSTVPLWGFREGPLFDRLGCLELPVSGGGSTPLSILDSWGFFAAPDRSRTPAEFLGEASALAAAHARAGAGIINVYADPSHVHGREEFFRAVEAWLEVAEPTSYRQLVASLA
jgi:hypothetical protein